MRSLSTSVAETFHSSWLKAPTESSLLGTVLQRSPTQVAGLANSTVQYIINMPTDVSTPGKLVEFVRNIDERILMSGQLLLLSRA